MRHDWWTLLRGAPAKRDCCLHVGIRYTVFLVPAELFVSQDTFGPLKTVLYCSPANEAVSPNQESTGANQEQLETISSPAGRCVSVVAMSQQSVLLMHTAWTCLHGLKLSWCLVYTDWLVPSHVQLNLFLEMKNTNGSLQATKEQRKMCFLNMKWWCCNQTVFLGLQAEFD